MTATLVFALVSPVPEINDSYSVGPSGVFGRTMDEKRQPDLNQARLTTEHANEFRTTGRAGGHATVQGERLSKPYRSPILRLDLAVSRMGLRCSVSRIEGARLGLIGLHAPPVRRDAPDRHRLESRAPCSNRLCLRYFL
jgi:hypothetical protein